MRILWVVSSGWAEGGVENSLILLRRVLKEKGHVVRVVSSDDRPDMPHFSDVEYHVPRGKYRWLSYTFNVSAYSTLRKEVAQFRPDVVHIHTIGHGSPSVLFALRGVPTLLTAHGPEGFIKSLITYCLPKSDFKRDSRRVGDLKLVGLLRYAYHRYLNRPFYGLGFRNVKRVLTPSRYMENLMRGEGLSNTRLPNGIRLFSHHPIEKKDLTRTFMYAGRLESFKGVDQLLSAVPAIVARFPDARLIVAGDGNEMGHLKDLARDLGIENNVEFEGYVDQRTLEGLYKRAMLTVVPSVDAEAFGLVGVESMSVGRPVIASDVGGISDWLEDGKSGILVRPREPEAIARAVSGLFEDKDRLLRMMTDARSRAEDFGIEKHAEDLLRNYKEVVGAH